MSAVLSSDTHEVLPRLTAVAAAVKGPGETVIDADTGTITFEHKSRSLLLAEAVAVHTEARELAPLIDSDSMYTEAADLLKQVTDSFKTLDEQRLSSTKPLRDKVDEINADYKPAIDKRKEAAEILKSGMLSYDREVERKRQQAEAEARARAEEERRRAAADARAAQQRAADEAAAARKAAEDKAANERTQAEQRATEMRAEADELEAAGNDARAAQLRAEARDLLGEAEEIAQTALFEGENAAAAATIHGNAEAEAMTAVATMVTPHSVEIARPRATGVSTRKTYGARVIDPKVLIAHVLANWDALNHLITIDLPKVNKLASDQKERFKLPGCELAIGDQIAARRR